MMNYGRMHNTAVQQQYQVRFFHLFSLAFITHFFFFCVKEPENRLSLTSLSVIDIPRIYMDFSVMLATCRAYPLSPKKKNQKLSLSQPRFPVYTVSTSTLTQFLTMGCLLCAYKYVCMLVRFEESVRLCPKYLYVFCPGRLFVYIYEVHVVTDMLKALFTLSWAAPSKE